MLIQPSIVKLAALASQIKLHGEITAQQLAAGLHADLLDAAISYIELRAEVAFDTLSTDAQYVLLKADAVVGFFVEIVSAADTQTLSDQTALSMVKLISSFASLVDTTAFGVTKTLSDSAFAVDSSTLIDGLEYGFQKRTVDQVLTSDLYSASITKPFTDIFSINDAQLRDVGKSASDSASTTDTLTKQTSFARLLAETSNPIDVSAKTVLLLEPVGTSRYVVAGYLVDGYVAKDSAFVYDQMSIRIQSYVLSDYFAQDYVGPTFGPY
jgi:hypothetical protein